MRVQRGIEKRSRPAARTSITGVKMNLVISRSYRVASSRLSLKIRAPMSLQGLVNFMAEDWRNVILWKMEADEVDISQRKTLSTGEEAAKPKTNVMVSSWQY